jgi:hypothetical protein
MSIDVKRLAVTLNDALCRSVAAQTNQLALITIVAQQVDGGLTIASAANVTQPGVVDIVEKALLDLKAGDGKIVTLRPS